MTTLSPAWRLRVYAALAVPAVLGLWALSDVIHWWVLAILGGAGILLGLALLSEFCRALAEVIGAVAVPWLCLLGFNLVWHWILDDHARPGLWVGLGLAFVVFAAASAAYLLAWRERRLATPFVAIGLALANVVGVPLLVAAPRHESVVAAPQAIVSQLDAAIVVPGAGRGPLGSIQASKPQDDLDVRYSVARAGPKRIDWLLVDSADPQAADAAALGAGARLPMAPAWRGGADQLVLLDVDGTSPVTPDPAALPSIPRTRGEVTRWLRVARRVRPQASVAVLLQTTDRRRIEAWARRVEPQGGSVASVQQLGTKRLSDAAVLLAAEAPGASEELSLAVRFRPVLLFDGRETLHTPLDIDAFLRSKRVDICHDDKLSGAHCDPVSRPSDLVNGATHLRIRKRDLRAPEPPSAIYVHPTAVKQGRRDLLYLDYWWYLDGNPAPVGRGISCGVGLALPGKTCFDHDSDWEGVTVVLDRTGGEATPVAIQYAEHSDVVRYDFAQLRNYWLDRERRDPLWLRPRFHRNLAEIDDLDGRPIAFVARGTHAAYRDVCPSGCRQVAKKLEDAPRDGLDSWPENSTAQCVVTGCVRLLPTRHGGRDPALWNAYKGVWGARQCILNGAYCTAEEAPAAPATQHRYKSPTRISGYVDAGWRFHPCGDEGSPCPALPLPGR